MPGWYVHLEAAHDTARKLRDGTVPPNFAIDPGQARSIGEHCHTWRNYLALGSLGPDLFYLLPDFKNTTGQVIRQVVKWALDVWEVVDAEFVSKWEKWIGPIATNNAQLASQLTGGLSTQLAQVLDSLTSAIIRPSRACWRKWATGSGCSRRACRRGSATTPSTGRTCSTTAGRTSSPSSSSSRRRTRSRRR